MRMPMLRPAIPVCRSNLRKTVGNAEVLRGVSGLSSVLSRDDGAEVGLFSVEHAVRVHGHACKLITVSVMGPRATPSHMGPWRHMAGRGAENTSTTDTLAKFGSTRTGTQNLLMDALRLSKSC